MKSGIHPNYKKATVKCACGNEFETGSVQEEIRVETCSECHPFYTGRQKFAEMADVLTVSIRNMALNHNNNNQSLNRQNLCLFLFQFCQISKDLYRSFLHRLSPSHCASGKEASPS